MIAHTPGPWKVYNKRLRPQMGGTIIEVQDNKDQSVVRWTGFDDCNVPKKTHLANARLIAAAPEMYELLKEVMVAFELEYELSAFKLKRISNLIQKIEGDK